MNSRAIDDTIKHHKYAKKIFGLGTHHDHLEGGYSRGNSIVTTGIHQNDVFILQIVIFIKINLI